MAVILTFPDASTLSIDAVIVQTHQRASDISKHKVEVGSDIADHIKPQPKTLTLSGIQSATPIVPEGVEPDPDRTRQAYDRLEAAHKNSELISVSTALDSYENMAITSLTYPREARTGSALIFSLDLEEVRFATAQTAKVPKGAFGKASPGATKAQGKAQKKKTSDQATPKNAKGQKSGNPPKAPEQAKVEVKKSLLVQLFGG